MRDLNTALCRVRQEEALFERTCEQAQEIIDAQIDQAMEPIMDAISYGEHDSDLANYFDAAMLMKIARTFATTDFEMAYSRCSDDLLHIKQGLKEYARDLAERRVDL